MLFLTRVIKLNIMMLVLPQVRTIKALDFTPLGPLEEE